MKQITRRAFLGQVGTVAMVAVWGLQSAAGKSRRFGWYRVRPAAEADVKPSDARFCTRARFRSAPDAIRAAARRGFRAEIYYGG